MNATIDPDLVKTVQQDVSVLKNDIDKMALEEEVNIENVKKALHDSQLGLEELRERNAIGHQAGSKLSVRQSKYCTRPNK